MGFQLTRGDIALERQGNGDVFAGRRARGVALTGVSVIALMIAAPLISPGPVFAAGTDLMGVDKTENFSTVGTTADPNAPYTNSGSFPTTTTLTLNTTAAGVIVTEAAGAIQQTSEPIALVVSGAGQISLQGANTYSGGTTLSSGALNITSAGALGATTGTLAVSGGVLDLGGTTQTQNGGLTLTGGTIKDGTLSSSEGFALQTGVVSASLSGAGTAAKTTAGIVTLSGANGYTGGTVVSAGMLDVTGAGTLGATANALTVSGGVLDLGGTTQTQNGGVTLTAGTIQDGTLSSSGSFALHAGTVSAVLAGSGSVAKTTAGVVTLSGADSYTGATVVSAGTLKGGAANAFSAASATTVAAGATVDVGGFAETISSLAGAGTVTNSGAPSVILTNQGASSAFTGTLVDGAGKLGLTQNAAGDTLTLSGANTYSGPTLVQAGTLEGGAANAFSANSATTVNTGATLDLGGVGQTITTVTLAGGTIKDGTLTSSGSITLQGGTVSAVLAGAATVSNVSGTTTLSAANLYTGGTTVSGGALDIAGAGTLGATSNKLLVSGGTLNLGGTTQTQNGGVTLTGGAIDGGTLSSSGTFALKTGTVGASLAGAGSVAKTTAGLVTLSGANLYSGATTISGGTLALSGTGSIATSSGVLIATGGTFDISKSSGAVSITTLGDSPSSPATGAVALGANTLDLTKQSSTFSGAIGGTGGLTLLGAGTETLAGANTYTGATLVSAGMLKGGAANAFSANSATTVAAGATLDLGGFAQTVSSLAGAGTVTDSGTPSANLTNQGASSAFAGAIVDGAGKTGLTQNGAGATLTLSGANTYTGATTISAGTLALSGSGSIATSSGVLIAPAGTFNISKSSGAVTITTLGDSSGGGAVALGANTLDLSKQSSTFSGAIGGTGGLTLQGAGVETLAGANTFTGATTISGGTLALSGAGSVSASSGVLVASGGTFDISKSSGAVSITTLGDSAGGGAVALGANTLNLTSQSSTFSGVIGGAGGLTLRGAGAETLAGVNTYTGGTIIAAGTLTLQGAGTLGASGGAVKVAGGTLNLGGTTQTQNGGVTLAAGTIEAGTLSSSTTFALQTGTVAASLVGSGSVSKTTTGAVTLSAVNSYTGGTTVSMGTLNVTGLGTLGATGNALTVSGGTLNLGGTTQTQNAGVTLTSGVIASGTLSSNGPFALQSGADSASLTGLGAVEKTTTGVVTLSMANGYSGGTTVSAGTLDITGAGTLGASGNALTVSGGVLDLGGTTQTQNGGVTLSGGTIQDGTLSSSVAFNLQSGTFAANLTGNDAVTKTTGGTVTLSGANTYSGPTLVVAGTLKAGATGAFSPNSATTVDAGATLDLGGFSQTVSALSGAGTVNNSGAPLAILTNQGASSTFSGSIQDDGPTGLTQNAPGNTLTLSGTNTYSGPTTISAGTIALSGSGSIATSSGVFIATGGTFDISKSTGSVSIATLGDSPATPAMGMVSLGANSLILTNQSSTFSGAIGGTGGLTFQGAGTETLAGVNTYSGATTLSSGTLVLTGEIGTNGKPSGNFTVAPNATLDINPGSVVASGDSSINLTGSLTNGGTVLVPATARITTTSATGFVNNGLLDIGGANDDATTSFTIKGNYTGQNAATLDVNLVTNANTKSANLLTINGNVGGSTTKVMLTDFQNGKATSGLFNGTIPVVVVNGTASSSAFALTNSGQNASPFPTLVSYSLNPTATGGGTTFNLISALNTKAVAGIGGGIGSAIGSATSGFFQGFTAFIGAPQNPTPNTISEGVWNRDAAGVNIEKSVASAQGIPTALDTITHFQGLQVGSDIGMFNIQNSGWNVNTGLTGGDYQSSSSELNGSNTTTNFNVPFLGVYGALSGHNFTGDILYRHDFWQGSVTSPQAGLTDAALNGAGDNVTMNAAYRFAFANGFAISPSAGFSYTRVTFNALSPFAATDACNCTNLLKMAPITSELGRLSVTFSDVFVAGDWALSPFTTAQIWHEFADPISGVFTSNFNGNLVVPYTDSRVGTFGQFGLGFAAQPTKLPNVTINLRADYRTGENIQGGTFTGAIRYQF